jgi:hypothetical protein
MYGDHTQGIYGNTTMPYPSTVPVNSDKFLAPAGCKHKSKDDATLASENADRERTVCSIGLDIHYELDVVAHESGAHQPRLRPFNPRVHSPACPHNYTGRFLSEEDYQKYADDPIALGRALEKVSPYDRGLYAKRDPRLTTKTVVIRDYGCKVPIDLADTEKLAKAVLNHYPDRYVEFLGDFVSNLFGANMARHLKRVEDGLQKLLDTPDELNRVSWGAYMAVQGGIDPDYKPDTSGNSARGDGGLDADCTLRWSNDIAAALGSLTRDGRAMTGQCTSEDVYDLRPCLNQHIVTLQNMRTVFCRGFGTKEAHVLLMLLYANEQGVKMCHDTMLMSESDTPSYDKVTMRVPLNLYHTGPDSDKDKFKRSALTPDKDPYIRSNLSGVDKSLKWTAAVDYPVGAWSGNADSVNVFLKTTRPASFQWGWGHAANVSLRWNGIWNLRERIVSLIDACPERHEDILAVANKINRLVAEDMVVDVSAWTPDMAPAQKKGELSNLIPDEDESVGHVHVLVAPHLRYIYDESAVSVTVSQGVELSRVFVNPDRWGGAFGQPSQSSLLSKALPTGSIPSVRPLRASIDDDDAVDGSDAGNTMFKGARGGAYRSSEPFRAVVSHDIDRVPFDARAAKITRSSPPNAREASSHTGSPGIVNPKYKSNDSCVHADPFLEHASSCTLNDGSVRVPVKGLVFDFASNESLRRFLADKPLETLSNDRLETQLGNIFDHYSPNFKKVLQAEKQWLKHIINEAGNVVDAGDVVIGGGVRRDGAHKVNEYSAKINLQYLFEKEIYPKLADAFRRKTKTGSYVSDVAGKISFKDIENALGASSRCVYDALKCWDGNDTNLDLDAEWSEDFGYDDLYPSSSAPAVPKRLNNLSAAVLSYRAKHLSITPRAASMEGLFGYLSHTLPENLQFVARDVDSPVDIHKTLVALGRLRYALDENDEVLRDGACVLLGEYNSNGGLENFHGLDKVKNSETLCASMTIEQTKGRKLDKKYHEAIKALAKVAMVDHLFEAMMLDFAETRPDKLTSILHHPFISLFMKMTTSTVQTDFVPSDRIVNPGLDAGKWGMRTITAAAPSTAPFVPALHKTSVEQPNHVVDIGKWAKANAKDGMVSLSPGIGDADKDLAARATIARLITSASMGTFSTMLLFHNPFDVSLVFESSRGDGQTGIQGLVYLPSSMELLPDFNRVYKDEETCRRDAIRWSSLWKKHGWHQETFGVSHKSNVLVMQKNSTATTLSIDARGDGGDLSPAEARRRMFVRMIEAIKARFTTMTGTNANEIFRLVDRLAADLAPYVDERGSDRATECPEQHAPTDLQYQQGTPVCMGPDALYSLGTSLNKAHWDAMPEKCKEFLRMRNRAGLTSTAGRFLFAEKSSDYYEGTPIDKPPFFLIAREAAFPREADFNIPNWGIELRPVPGDQSFSAERDIEYFAKDDKIYRLADPFGLEHSIDATPWPDGADSHYKAGLEAWVNWIAKEFNHSGKTAQTGVVIDQLMQNGYRGTVNTPTKQGVFRGDDGEEPLQAFLVKEKVTEGEEPFYVSMITSEETKSQYPTTAFQGIQPYPRGAQGGKDMGGTFVRGCVAISDKFPTGDGKPSLKRVVVLPVSGADYNSFGGKDSAKIMYNYNMFRPQFFAVIDATALLWHAREFESPSDNDRPGGHETDQPADMHPWCVGLCEAFIHSRQTFMAKYDTRLWETEVKTNPSACLGPEFIGSVCDETWSRHFPLLPNDHSLRQELRKIRALDYMWGTLPAYTGGRAFASSSGGAWMPLSMAHQVRLLDSVGLFDRKYNVPANPWTSHDGRGISRVFNQSYHSVYHTDTYRAPHFREWIKSALRYRKGASCIYPFSEYGGTPVEADFVRHRVERPASDAVARRHRQLFYNRFGFHTPFRIGRQYHDTGLLQDMLSFEYRPYADLSTEQRNMPPAAAVYPSNFLAYARNHAIIALASCNHGTDEPSGSRIVRNLYRLYVDTYACMGAKPDDDGVPAVMGFLPTVVQSREDRPVTIYAGSLACVNSKLESFCASDRNRGERVCRNFKQTYLNDATLLFTRMLRQERRKLLHRKNYNLARMKRGTNYTENNFKDDLIDLQDAYVEFLQTTILGMLIESGADLNGAPLHLLEPRELEVSLYEEDDNVVGNDYLSPSTMTMLQGMDFNNDKLTRSQLAILSLIPPNHRILGTLRLNQDTSIVDMAHVKKRIQQEAIASNKTYYERYAQQLFSAAFAQKLLEVDGPIDFGFDMSAVQDPSDVRFDMKNYRDPLAESEMIRDKFTTTHAQASSSVSQNLRAQALRREGGAHSTAALNSIDTARALNAVREAVEKDYARQGGSVPRIRCLAALQIPDYIKRMLRSEYASGQ